MSPEQMQLTAKKWMDWKNGLENNGYGLQLGERLDVVAKVVRGKSKTITDGPYVEVRRGNILKKPRGSRAPVRKWSFSHAR